jgi:hypothetical protein
MGGDLMTVAVTVLGVAVALLGILVVGLLRSHAEVLRRLHELGAGVYDEDLPDGGRSARAAPVALGEGPAIRTREGVAPPRDEGTPAYDIAGLSPRGEAVSVGIVGAPHTTLLAFLTSGCSTCAGFWSAFAAGVTLDLPLVGGEEVRLVVVTRGPEQESPAEVLRLAPPGVTVVMSSAAFDDYAVPVNPYFILVDGPGAEVIGEGAAATWAQVAGLLGRAAADQGYEPVGVGAGVAGPDAFEDLRDGGYGPDDGYEEGYDDDGDAFDDGVDTFEDEPVGYDDTDTSYDETTDGYDDDADGYEDDDEMAGETVAGGGDGYADGDPDELLPAGYGIIEGYRAPASVETFQVFEAIEAYAPIAPSSAGAVFEDEIVLDGIGTAREEWAAVDGAYAAGLRGPNAEPGLRGPNAEPGLRGANAEPARDSRQRDALAEAELFVAGIGPGHPSLYPDRLHEDPVITEDL